MSSPATPTTPEAPRDGRIRLLGVLGCAALSSFHHLAMDAALAPEFEQRVAMLAAAGARMDVHRQVAAQITAAEADPVAAMVPYQPQVDDFHARTRPRSWPEALVKAWVTGGVSSDFCAELADAIPPGLADRVGGQDPSLLTVHAPQWLATVLDQDPGAAGRLALWARRLVGEMMTRTQRLAVDDEVLAGRVTGTGGGLVELHAMIARLVSQHNQRMATVGLAA